MCSLLLRFHCVYYSYKPQAFILKIDYITSANQLVRSALFHFIIAMVIFTSTPGLEQSRNTALPMKLAKLCKMAQVYLIKHLGNFCCQLILPAHLEKGYITFHELAQ